MTRPAAAWRIGAVGSLSAALALAQFLVPIAGVLLSLFAPLPLLWLVRDAGGRPAGGARGRSASVAGERSGSAGERSTLWPVGAAALLAAGLPAVADPDLALGLVARFGPLTAVLGLGLRRGWSLAATVGGAAGATMAVGLAALLVLSGLDPIAAGKVVTAQVEAAVASALARTAGDALDHRPLAALFVRLLPGLALVGTLAAAWVNLFVLRWRAGRKPDRRRAAENGEDGHAGGRPPLDDWSRWSAPEPLVFVLVLGGAALLPGVPAATTVGLNLLVVVGFVYFMQGLAIVGFFFRTREIPLALRVAGYTLIGALQLLPVVVASVGLADLWVDFRRRALRPSRGGPVQGAPGGIAPHDSENGGSER